jgi:hypothetical protein
VASLPAAMLCILPENIYANFFKLKIKGEKY